MISTRFTNSIAILVVSVFASFYTLKSEAQNLPITPNSPSIGDTFVNTFFQESGDAFASDNWGHRLNSIFGIGASWTTFYPENQIAHDGKRIYSLYKELSQAQNEADPIIRTRDLTSPFNSSLLTNPDYLSTME